MMEKLLSTKQVCDMYGVSREAVRLWRNKGCPFICHSPRKIFYNYDDLKFFVQTKTNIILKNKLAD